MCGCKFSRRRIEAARLADLEAAAMGRNIAHWIVAVVFVGGLLALVFG
jgi:hypothetical protein